MLQDPKDYDAVVALAGSLQTIQYTMQQVDGKSSGKTGSHTKPSNNNHRHQSYSSAAGSSSSSYHHGSSSRGTATPMELGTTEARPNFRAGGRRPPLPRADISEAEARRRRENDLCMFCGEPGHRAAMCKKREKAAGKQPARH